MIALGRSRGDDAAGGERGEAGRDRPEFAALDVAMVLAAYRPAHEMAADIAERLARHPGLRPSHETARRPGIASAKDERREHTRSYVAPDDTIPGEAEAVQDFGVPRQATKGRNAGPRAVDRPSPTG